MAPARLTHDYRSDAQALFGQWAREHPEHAAQLKPVDSRAAVIATQVALATVAQLLGDDPAYADRDPLPAARTMTGEILAEILEGKGSAR